MTVSIVGAIVTAISIIVTDKVTGAVSQKRTLIAAAIGTGVSALTTFITGYIAEKAGLNPYVRGLIVGITTSLSYVLVRKYA